MKALSLWEPWASLMMKGAKTVETRSWPTRYRGPLVICAAKRVDRGALRLTLGDDRFADALFGQDFRPCFDEMVERLHFGHAVAIVRLERVVRTEEYKPTEEERPFGDYSPGRFGWVTTDLEPLEPFPVTGRQGLFNLSSDDYFEIARQRVGAPKTGG